MKTLTIFCLTLFFFSTNTFAQEHLHTDQCGHNIIMKSMEANFPGYAAVVDHTFENAKKAMDPNQSRSIYTIPVVVHVVWKEAAENISDERIQEQIDALNEDFRALNPDIANLRSEFDGISGDPMIEFDLVAIERVETNETFGVDLLTGFEDNKLKESANGGSSPYDTETHLNIWVCNIQPLGIGPLVLGQILGYAYPPVNIADYPEINNWPSEQMEAFQNPAYDGVVMHYPTFGGRDNEYNDPNLGGAITFQGRSTAHEVGHYLGLRHIWGDPDPLSGQDGCTVDDGIDDTPNAADNSQATGCVNSKNTCTGGADDLPDMWENYMDYAVEACQVSFTQEQADLMRAVLEGPRVGLLGDFVGTDENMLANQISFAPNPTTGMLSIRIDHETSGNLNLVVRDILGRVVLEDFNLSNSQMISLSDQENGVYFIEIKDGSSSTISKVLLQK